MSLERSTSGPTKGAYLEIIMGPMFSGKTRELLARAKKYKAVGLRVLVITHKADIRYSEVGLCTHDKEEMPALRVSELMPVTKSKEYQQADLILIEEGNFYGDLFEFTMQALRDQNRVLVAGLNGTSEKEHFGDLHRLIPHADEILFLRALCSICRDGTTPGVFTMRRQPKEKDRRHEVHVGGQDEYLAVCREHFNEEVCE